MTNTEQRSGGARRRRRRGPSDRPWKTIVRARIARIEDELRLSETLGVSTPVADVARAAVKAELARARDALGPGGEGGRRLWLWWTGSDQEQAWLAVHAAEVQLTLAQRDEALRAELPVLEAKVRSRLKSRDALVTAWIELLAKARKSSDPVDRFAIRQMKETLYEVSDGGHVRTRSFRNILVVVIAILALAVGVLAIPQVSDWIPLETTASSESDTDPAGEAAEPNAEGSPEIQPADPDGTDSTQEADSSLDSVWQVELLGALGGLLAALSAVQRLRGFRNPYNLPLVQAVLKIPAGALTALTGLVLMQSGIIFLEPQEGAALGAYAIFFGAAQDVITRLVDRKAREITEITDPVEAAAGQTVDG